MFVIQFEGNFAPIGPFDSHDDAQRFKEKHLQTLVCEVVFLIPPDVAPEG